MQYETLRRYLRIARENGIKRSLQLNLAQPNVPPPGKPYGEAIVDKPYGLNAVRKVIAKEHPWHYQIIEWHYWWLKRKAQKFGLNPEDARWLL